MKLIATLLVGLQILFVLPSTALAFTFDPEYIISDEDFIDSDSLALDQIYDQLERGTLFEYETEDYEGNMRYAAEIIYLASKTYEISPKVLIVLLQKEQSLIEDDDPSDNQLAWATGYGVCDDCSKSDPAIQRWKGFGKQVNSAAAQFMEGYFADIDDFGITTAGYGPGIEVEIDGVDITPLNAATAALYSYTPHFHGNENFAKIWDRYFTPYYPNGSLLQAAGEDGVWLIQNGEKRPITSAAALYSRFDASRIISVDPYTLDQYDTGKEIAFSNYSLLLAEDGTVYLIVNDEIRPIDSWETFVSIGFSSDELIEVDDEDLEDFEIGAEITIETAYPSGTLLQNTDTGGVYFVEDGVKYPIQTRDVLDINFLDWPIVPTSPLELDDLDLGDPVQLPDGLLVKSDVDPSVYVISDSELRPVLSASIFEQMHFAWEDIVSVSESTLNLHDIGDPIEAIGVENDFDVTLTP